MMDYTTTSYGVQGAAGAGGFSQGGSQGDGTTAKSYEKDTLRPVTIKQLLDAKSPHPDGAHKVDGTEITSITFVGQVRNISSQATNVTYRLDDGTGTIDVKLWVDAEASDQFDDDNDHGMGGGGGGGAGGSSSSKPKIVEQAWVRVWGSLKSFNDRCHVYSRVIRPVTDHNEIQYHLLEATLVHLYFTRGPPQQQHGATSSQLDQKDFQQQGGLGAAAAGDAREKSMSPLARQVWNAMKSVPRSNDGVHTQQISAQTGMSLADVLKGGEELFSAGVIYTTIDDDTWAMMD